MIGIVRDDRGSASVTAAFVMLSLVLITGMSMSLCAIVAARHRCQAAADLSALAGAAVAVDGPEMACATGRSIADRMSVKLAKCELAGLDLTVEMAAGVELGRLGSRQVSAVATATTRD